MGDATREYAENWKARAVRRLRVMVSKEEFDAQIQRCIERGQLQAEDVEIMLKGTNMQESESREYRALVLLRDYGELTSGQLHSMLGLGEDELPSEVLGELLSSGSVVKIGKYWRLFEEDDARLASHYMPNERQIAAWPMPIQPGQQDLRTCEERAIEFLRSRPDGRCTNLQMAEILRASIRQVSTSLKLSVDRKLLVRDGSDWILGPNRRTNVEQAIAYLQDHPERRASNAEMCEALGYKVGTGLAALTTGLRSGLRTGRLLRNGGAWMLGEAAEAA